jgi:hypothetical protein
VEIATRFAEAKRLYDQVLCMMIKFPHSVSVEMEERWMQNSFAMRIVQMTEGILYAAANKKIPTMLC